MKIFTLVKRSIISSTFFFVSNCLYAGSNVDHEYKKIPVKVGLDCDRKTSSLSVLMKFDNKKRESIYLGEDQLLLTQYMPNIFELIPNSFSGSKGYKYAAPYLRPIKIDVPRERPKKSAFRLYPTETIIIRHPVSSFYKLDFNTTYNATTFYSYLLSNKKEIFSSQVNFTINHTCFDEQDVIWLDDVTFSGGVINNLDQDEQAKNKK